LNGRAERGSERGRRSKSPGLVVASVLLALAVLDCPPAISSNKALLIGVSQYAEITNLSYPDQDVRDLAVILREFAGYTHADVSVLLNQQATKNAIENEFEKLIDISERDSIDHVIVMFAGHGQPKEKIQELYGRNRRSSIFLTPSDGSVAKTRFYVSGHDEVKNDTFIDKAWLSRKMESIQAKTKVLVLDSCYAGIRDFGDLLVRNRSRSAKRDMHEADRSHLAFLAASSDEEQAAEFKELQHGALSYCILKHLEEVRVSTEDEKWRDILIRDLFPYVLEQFRRVIVQGRRLIDYHEPVLFPIPDYESVSQMRFVAIRGTRRDTTRSGTFGIETDPAGVELWVDGTRTTKTTPCELELTEGKHHIALVMPHTDYRHTLAVDIRAGHRLQESYSLRGDLTVESYWEEDGREMEGPALDVYVDGRSAGKTRLSVKDLVAGTHSIDVRYQQASHSRKIEIRPDSPLRIKYVVVKEKETRDPRSRKPPPI
jgi:hypothetical protein